MLGKFPTSSGGSVKNLKRTIELSACGVVCGAFCQVYAVRERLSAVEVSGASNLLDNV